jgi:hypothetical protein
VRGLVPLIPQIVDWHPISRRHRTGRRTGSIAGQPGKAAGGAEGHGKVEPATPAEWFVVGQKPYCRMIEASAPKITTK